jgi:histidinol-phosphate aminotransferase
MIDACENSPSWIRAIAAYVPGKPAQELAREMGLDEAGIVKLASNENPLGPGPAALVAMQAAIADIARYPDGNGFELKAAIQRHRGVDTERIVLGNGSNDVLELVGRTFLTPGTSAVYSQHAFAVYPLTVQAQGATHIQVPAREHGHDLDVMAAAVREDTRIVFIANPNNPTGTFVPGDALQRFLRRPTRSSCPTPTATTACPGSRRIRISWFRALSPRRTGWRDCGLASRSRIPMWRIS